MSRFDSSPAPALLTLLLLAVAVGGLYFLGVWRQPEPAPAGATPAPRQTDGNRPGGDDDARGTLLDDSETDIPDPATLAPRPSPLVPRPSPALAADADPAAQAAARDRLPNLARELDDAFHRRDFAAQRRLREELARLFKLVPGDVADLLLIPEAAYETRIAVIAALRERPDARIAPPLAAFLGANRLLLERPAMPGDVEGAHAETLYRHAVALLARVDGAGQRARFEEALLACRNPPIAAALIEALRAAGGWESLLALETFIAHSPDSKSAALAVAALGQLTPREEVAPLVRVLSAPGAPLAARLEAMRALGEKAPDVAFPALADWRARETDEEARAVLVVAAGGLAVADADAFLEAVIASNASTRERCAAVSAYARRRRAEAAPRLKEIIAGDRDPQVAVTALAELIASGAPGIEPLLASRAASEQSEDMRAAALGGLLQRAPTDANVEIVRRAVAEDPRPRVRAAAARALANAPGSTVAEEALVAAARGDGAPEVRAAAVMALAKRPDVLARRKEFLLDLSRNDPSPHVRGQVARALHDLGVTE
ncbi:MAG: HEAT repeat domain-containing protein [Planctomycetes bacterium]|nr:HEAT repeat domain-containing protein [Planctomycetota bacterium]